MKPSSSHIRLTRWLAAMALVLLGAMGWGWWMVVMVCVSVHSVSQGSRGDLCVCVLGWGGWCVMVCVCVISFSQGDRGDLC